MGYAYRYILYELLPATKKKLLGFDSYSRVEHYFEKRPKTPGKAHNHKRRKMKRNGKSFHPLIKNNRWNMFRRRMVCSNNNNNNRMNDMDNNDDILTNKKNNTEDKAKSVTSQCDCHKSKEASRNKEDPLQWQVERRETLSPTSIVDIIPMGSIALTKQQDDDEEDVASYTQMLYVQSNGSTLSLKGNEREHDLSSSSSRLVTEEQLTDLSVDKVALSMYRLRRQQQQQQLQNRRQHTTPTVYYVWTIIFECVF